MSIRIQCCGIVVLLILIFFQGKQKRTRLTTERFFRWVIAVSLICLALDVGSVLAVNHFLAPGRAVSPTARMLVDLICKVYLVTLPAMGLVTLLYICADTFYAQPDRLRLRGVIYGTLFLISAAAILALPVEYHKNAAGVITNTAGPSVYATYFFIIVFFFFIFRHLLRDRARMNHRRLRAILVWLTLWLGSFFLQLMDNSILVAGFACAVGVLIIYLSLENPEGNLDRQSGLFRREVLKSYLQQLYGQERDFALLALLFDRTQDGDEEPRIALMRYLERQHKWMAFRVSDDRVYFTFDTAQQAQAAMEQVNEYLAKHRRTAAGLPMKTHWLLMPSAQEAEGSEDLMALLKEIAHKHVHDAKLVTVDTQLIMDIRRDWEIEQLLADAIEEDRIEVFYQPIYSLSQQRITAAEALVRIRDQEGRLVSPGMFIPIAESNGMILRLGRMIFEHVCRFIKAHPLDQLGLNTIDVNLSVIQCAYADLAEDYMAIMRHYGVDPAHINLEITESASIHEKNTLLLNMEQLIDFGVSFALDDFGTGQSNLAYIMNMPVAVAKFDRQITQAYFVNDKAKHVMNAAVRMIHDMGISIVSEGVETAEELKAIADLGIEYIQGFYFSKPLPEQEFLDYLKTFQAPAASKA